MILESRSFRGIGELFTLVSRKTFEAGLQLFWSDGAMAGSDPPINFDEVRNEVLPEAVVGSLAHWQK